MCSIPLFSFIFLGRGKRISGFVLVHVAVPVVVLFRFAERKGEQRGHDQ